MMPVTSFVPTDLSNITLIGVAKSGSIVLLCKRYETKTRLVTGGSISFMQTNNQVPRFAILHYQVMHDLEISIQEYFLLDMIFRLSGNNSRWCNKKIENIATDMRMSISGVRKLRDRLIERKLLLKGVGNRLRTSEKVYKVYFLDESELGKSVQSAPKSALSVQKSVQKVKKTPVEKYYRSTKEKKDDFVKAQNPTVDGPGRAYALQKLDEIKRRKLDKFGLGAKHHA